MELYKKVCGEDHPDVAITYHNLGLLFSNLPDRLNMAEEMYLKGSSCPSTKLNDVK